MFTRNKSLLLFLSLFLISALLGGKIIFSSMGRGKPSLSREEQMEAAGESGVRQEIPSLESQRVNRSTTAKIDPRTGIEETVQVAAGLIIGHDLSRSSLGSIASRLREEYDRGSLSAGLELFDINIRCMNFLSMDEGAIRNDKTLSILRHECESVEIMNREKLSAMIFDISMNGLEEATLKLHSYPPEHVHTDPNSQASKNWYNEVYQRLRASADAGNIEASYQISRLYGPNNRFGISRMEAIDRVRDFLGNADRNDNRRRSAENWLERITWTPD